MKFVVFVVAPIIEIVAAALVAHFVGWGWTVLALIVLSVIGARQIKVQGLTAWRTARRELSEGAATAPAVLDGALRLVGAVLLCLPGFVSALVGFALLVAPLRGVASRRTAQWVITRFGMPFTVVRDARRAGWRFGSTDAPDIVDVEGWEEPVAAPGRHELTRHSGSRS